MSFASALLTLAFAAGQQNPDESGAPLVQPASLSAASALELAHAAASLPRRVKRESGGWGWSAPLLELRRRVEAGERFDSEVWRVLLVEGGYLRWRADWPLEAPFAVGLTGLPLSHSFELWLEPRVEGWSSASVWYVEGMCGHGSDSLAERASYQELGRLNPDQCEVRFEVFIDSGVASAVDTTPAVDTKLGSDLQSNPGPDFSGRRQRVGEFAIEVRPRERFDDVLTPVTDFAVSRTIAHALRIGVGSDAKHVPCATLTIDSPPWPNSLSCAFEIELLRKGRLVSAQSFAFRASHSRTTGFGWFRKLSPQIARGDLPASGWTLRLRGARFPALRNWDATHYWAGTLELPLADIVSRSPGRSRGRGRVGI